MSDAKVLKVELRKLRLSRQWTNEKIAELQESKVKITERLKEVNAELEKIEPKKSEVAE